MIRIKEDGEMNSLKYGIIICPHCSSSRIIEQQHKTITCIRCRRRLSLKKIRIHFETNSIEEARQILGQINAEKDGQLESFKKFINK